MIKFILCDICGEEGAKRYSFSLSTDIAVYDLCTKHYIEILNNTLDFVGLKFNINTDNYLLEEIKKLRIEQCNGNIL